MVAPQEMLSRVGGGGSKRARMMQQAAAQPKGGTTGQHVSAQRPILRKQPDPYEFPGSDGEAENPETPSATQRTPTASQHTLRATTPYGTTPRPATMHVFSRRATTPGARRQGSTTPSVLSQGRCQPTSSEALTLLGKRPSLEGRHLDQPPPSEADSWLLQIAPPGMRNHINTCYMNAVLQVMLSLQPFTSALQALHATQPATSPTPAGCNTAPPSAPPHVSPTSSEPGLRRSCLQVGAVQPEEVGALLRHTSLTQALAVCLEELQAATQHNLSGGVRQASISPLRVKRCMRGGDWRSSSHQQDAHEFLVALMQNMLAELMIAQYKASVLKSASCMQTACCQEAPGAVVHTPATQQQQSEGGGGGGGVKAGGVQLKALHARLGDVVCPGVRTFHGCLQHTYVCSACGYESHTKEQFSHLSLKIPHPPEGAEPHELPTLRDLLDAHFQDEVVDKTCDACQQQHVNHTARHQLCRLPPVLALQLKRFAHAQEDGVSRYFKLQSLISLPRCSDATLDLGCYCCPDAHPHTFLTQHLATANTAGPTADRRTNPRTPGHNHPVVIDCCDEQQQGAQGPAVDPVPGGADHLVHHRTAAPTSLGSHLDQQVSQSYSMSHDSSMLPATQRHQQSRGNTKPRLGGPSVGAAAAMDIALGFGSTGTVSCCRSSQLLTSPAYCMTRDTHHLAAGSRSPAGAPPLANPAACSQEPAPASSQREWRGFLRGGTAGAGGSRTPGGATAGGGFTGGQPAGGASVARVNSSQFFGSSPPGSGQGRGYGSGCGAWWEQQAGAFEGAAATVMNVLDSGAQAEGRTRSQAAGGAVASVQQHQGGLPRVAPGCTPTREVMTLSDDDDDDDDFPGLKAALAASMAEAQGDGQCAAAAQQVAHVGSTRLDDDVCGGAGEAGQQEQAAGRLTRLRRCSVAGGSTAQGRTPVPAGRAVATGTAQAQSPPQVIDLISHQDEEAQHMALAVELSRQEAVRAGQAADAADAELQAAIRESMAGHDAEYGNGDADGSKVVVASDGKPVTCCVDAEVAGGSDESDKADSSCDDVGEVTLIEDEEVQEVATSQDHHNTLCHMALADRPALHPMPVDQWLNMPALSPGTTHTAVQTKSDDKPGAATAGHMQLPPPLPLLSTLAHYSLRGAVCHRGSTPFSGHYVAHALLPVPPRPVPATPAGAAPAGSPKAPANPLPAWQWWRYDDTEVTPVTAARARQEMGKTGYLLFLVAQSPNADGSI